MSALKKSKSNIMTSSSSPQHKKDKHSHHSVAAATSIPKKKSKQQRKLFTVKFKVEEAPIMSLFTRDNSSRGGGGGDASAKDVSQNKKHNSEQESQSHSSASDGKRLRKYLKMVKPLYVRVSRRYAEKLRFSGQLNISSSDALSSDTAAQKPAPLEEVAEKVMVPTEGEPSAAAGGSVIVKGQKQRNLALTAGLRVVCKHLGKSRSPETVAEYAPVSAELVSSRRRDDSLMQQHDGIQGAILHCKRSFNVSREIESSQLVSDPLHEIPPELSSKCSNEGKSKK